MKKEILNMVSLLMVAVGTGIIVGSVGITDFMGIIYQGIIGLGISLVGYMIFWIGGFENGRNKRGN